VTLSDASDWRPAASRAMLQARADILQRIRQFFADRGVLEVDTPVLSHAAATDVHLTSIATFDGAARGYLQTSPEYAMKRLLASGSGAIFQICKVFRAGESGRRHNPEFTMLEWYRPGLDHHQLMDEVAALVRLVLGPECGPEDRLTYRDAFLRHAGIDPLAADGAALAARAQALGLAAVAGLAPEDLDGWRDYLLTAQVEPELGRGGLCFLVDYPASQAALARIRPGPPAVAERFELYVAGIELANGFHELGDAAELEARFTSDNQRRRARGLPEMPVDTHLLAALRHGLPPCAGVALGLDRLVMLATHAPNLRAVLAFPADRA